MRRLTGLMASLVLASSWFAGDADAVSLGELLAARTLGENFGVQVKEWETTGDDLDNIKAAGFGLLRYGIGWPYVEQKVGTYVREKYDQMISGARARGFSLDCHSDGRASSLHWRHCCLSRRGRLGSGRQGHVAADQPDIHRGFRPVRGGRRPPVSR
jgi:hypothetical protein